MSFVSGNSESARQLQNILNLTMRNIEEDVDNLERAARDVKNGWEDEGAEEVDEMLASLKSALLDATEASSAVEKALDAYAAFLERT